MSTVLYLAVPCYNEEEVLPFTSKTLLEKMRSLVNSGKISDKSRIVFINDGSKDKTWELITEYTESDPMFSGIKLSKNKGHQNALLAGLMTVKEECDCCISLDADLQDDIEAIDKMLECYENGCDIVYGVRNERKTDTFFKKTTAQGFYKLMRLMGADIIYNHADYRLMSRRALCELENFSEVNLFLRGIVPMIGFKYDTVYYARREREHGESKYPLKKMLAFAIDGVTSLSVKPIRMITTLGIIILFISLAMLIYSLISYFTGHTEPGWASLIVSLWAIGGMQLFAIGIVGEYIGKIYLETKHRPKFIIDKYIKHG